MLKSLRDTSSVGKRVQPVATMSPFGPVYVVPSKLPLTRMLPEALEPVCGHALCNGTIRMRSADTKQKSTSPRRFCPVLPVLRSIAGLGVPFYDDYTFGIHPDLTPAKCAPAETPTPSSSLARRRRS